MSRGRLKITLAAPSSAGPSAEDIFSSRWARLQSFLDAVYALSGLADGARAPSTFSYEELYGGVVDVCSQRQSAALYERLLGSLEARAGALLGGVRAELAPGSGALLLASLRGAWATFTSELTLVGAVFQHLDRSHVALLPGARSLWHVGVALWGAQLEGRRGALLARAVGALCEAVELERRGDTVDRGALAAVVRMLGAVDLMARHAVPPLLESTSAFFEAEGARLIGAGHVADFLLHVERRLREEHNRHAAYLGRAGEASGGGAGAAAADGALLSALVSRVEAALLERNAAAIVEGGVASLLQAGRLEDLRRLYLLLSGVRHEDDVRAHFVAYVKMRCAEIVGKDPEKGSGGGGGGGGGAPEREADKTLIANLLDLKAACDAAVARSFCGSPAFSNALRSALVLCVNARADRAAELLAKWVDARMRAAGGGAGWEAEQEKAMDRALALFRLIHGKDVFEAFYKKDLAKRLLLRRSNSTDSEKAMVVRLKGECGAAFTAKLECMFKDVEVSRALSEEFRGVEGGGGGGGGSPASPRSPASPAAGGGGGGGGEGKFFVHLLTATHWPTYPLCPGLRLPPELAPFAAAFDAFYQRKHASRKTAWVSQLGSCELRAAFPAGVKTLDVSQHQAMALLLFNEGGAEAPTLTAAAIRAATGIEAEELKRTLQSLALGLVRVLKKEPKGREVEDGDAFSFNAAFAHSLTRLKVNQIQLSETKAEAEDTNERVASDRLYQIDAAVVRVLKARKTLEHTALMGELLSQLRFAAQTADIKKRLESLIERDYISRDARDPKVYHYSA